MDKAEPLRSAILENLRSGVWPPGHQLPTERALCERFGVSRTTVRKTLGELKARGLITQTVGSGTFVRGPEQKEQGMEALRQEVSGTSPAELMAARLALEPAIIGLVVQHATSADFALMDECCEQAEAAATFEGFEQWDAKLHEVIAQAAHNSFVHSVFRLIDAARSHASWGALKRKSLTHERRRAYEAQHRELVAALKDRDATRATEQARRHLLNVRDNLLGG